MSLEAKVDRALELLFKMEPTVSEIRMAQKSAESRERVNDAKVTAHGVEIKNLKDRVDGLHSKLNVVHTVPAEPTRWGAIAEFLGALPAYWHVVAAALGGAVSVGGIILAILKHRGP